MNARLKSFLRVFLSITFALLFLYLAFRGSDFDKLVLSLKGANYLFAILLIPCLLLSHLVRAWRWKYLLEPIKKDLSFRNLFSSLMVGYMVNNVLPRVGEIVRPYSLGRLERISKSAVFGTVLVERIIDILSFLFFLAVILVFYQGPLVRVFPWIETAGLILAAVTLGVFGVFGLVLSKRDRVFGWLRKLMVRLPGTVGEKLERLLHSFLDGFLIIKEPRRYAVILVLSAVIWFWYAVMMYIPFYAFGMVDRYSLNFLAAVITMVMSAIGFIIPAPGGTGSYHWIARETLVNLFNVDVEVALSYATVTHLLGIISVTSIGLVFFLRDNLKVSEAIQASETRKLEVEFLSEEK